MLLFFRVLEGQLLLLQSAAAAAAAWEAIKQGPAVALALTRQLQRLLSEWCDSELYAEQSSTFGVMALLV